MYIYRHIQKGIERLSRDFPVVLITGPRQVGKSTTLLNQFPEYQYITLDDRVVLGSLVDDPVGFLKSLKLPAILDEIQRSPGCFTDIKCIVDKKKKKGLFYLSGSQRYQLMKDVSESLAGRIGIVEMPGLSLREIYGRDISAPFSPDDDKMDERVINDVDLSDLWNVIHRGSMPELYAHPDADWENYYSAYVSTYIERDVRDIINIGNTMSFMEFMTALAARTGELLNLHSIASEIGIDDKTAKSWLSVLEASGLVFLLRPFSLNLTKRAIKAPKIYFTDTGLVAYLCRWLTPETLKNGSQSGSMFETYVVDEILRSYKSHCREAPIYYFRTTNGQEIDILFYRDGTLYPVEIKKKSSPSAKDIRHFKILETYFPAIPVGAGGVICSYESVLHLTENHRVIPVTAI